MRQPKHKRKRLSDVCMERIAAMDAHRYHVRGYQCEKERTFKAFDYRNTALSAAREWVGLDPTRVAHVEDSQDESRAGFIIVRHSDPIDIQCYQWKESAT